MSCEDCVSRREFLAKSTLAAAGLAVAVTGCGDGHFGPTAASASVTNVSVKVASLPGLSTVGQLVVIPPESALIVAKRTGTNTFAAFSQICTHQGCATSLTGNILVCPCHGARYDANGSVVRQPDGGTATALASVPVRYDAATDTLTLG